MKNKEVTRAVIEVERMILDINKTLCDNIDLFDFDNVTRALVSQNLLSQSRNLVEHIAVRAYLEGKDIPVNWKTINEGLDYIKQSNKYYFLCKFHTFLQESKSHYTPDAEGAERLMLKYYQYFMMIREFVKDEYGMEILNNLEKFPVDQDETIELFHEKIVEKLQIRRAHIEYGKTERLYVHKVVPFVVEGRVYYEMVLTPAYDTTSKFDRFVCYSSILVPDHYSIKSDIHYEKIDINGRKMPVNILTDFVVSVRPCELNNFGYIFTGKSEIKSNNLVYDNLMNFISKTATNLLDLLTCPDDFYNSVKAIIIERAKNTALFDIFDVCRNRSAFKFDYFGGTFRQFDYRRNFEHDCRRRNQSAQNDGHSTDSIFGTSPLQSVERHRSDSFFLLVDFRMPFRFNRCRFSLPNFTI